MRQQAQDDTDVETNEGPRDTHQCTGEVASRSSPEARKPTVGIAVEGETNHDPDRNNDKKVRKRYAANCHWSSRDSKGANSWALARDGSRERTTRSFPAASVMPVFI
jgi:hypothetical protein